MRGDQNGLTVSRAVRVGEANARVRDGEIGSKSAIAGREED